jgi:hypothetical protein
MGQNEPYCTYRNSSRPGSNRVRWSLHIIHFKHVLTQLFTVSAFKRPHSGYMPYEKVFKPPQDLCGHTGIQSFHLSYYLYPPYSGCHWRGDRADESSKRLVKQKCDKTSEAAEYRTYGEKVILDQIKNAGCADSFQLLKPVQLVSFKRGPKRAGGG